MADEVYTVSEIVAAAEKIMSEYKPYLIAAALRTAGGDRYTVAQARDIVYKFANKKV